MGQFHGGENEVLEQIKGVWTGEGSPEASLASKAR